MDGRGQGHGELAMAKRSGIYRIHCMENDKFYIGSAIDIDARWRVHRCELRNEKHGNSKLQRAWKKYGEAAFIFTVVELVPDADKLIEREQFHIDETVATIYGFNLRAKADSNIGLKYVMTKRRPPHTEASKLKMSATHKGKKLTPEHVAKVRASQFKDITGRRFGRLVVLRYSGTVNVGTKGGRVTSWDCRCDCGGTVDAVPRGSLKNGNTKSCGCLYAETRRRVLTDSDKAKISASHIGKTKTREHCEKIRKAMLGKKYSAERCAAISAGHIGQIVSAEHREKISKALSGRKHSPQRVAAIIDGKRLANITRASGSYV